MITSTDKRNKNLKNKFISRHKQQKFKVKTTIITSLLLIPLVIFLWLEKKEKNPVLELNFPPLEMSEGTPYIRALMRTISAAESNTSNPYIALYGGKHFHDFSRHPNRCIPIVTGPNIGKCTTAAGRYQFLTETWLLKAAKYHPAPQRTSAGITYSFEPKYQDIVVYRWLKDRHQWDVRLLTLLKEDRVEDVLTELSDVWTSLGAGIEDNSMTSHLPKLYRQFLAQELQSQGGEQVSQNHP
jgi:nickel/cobalt tolerance cation efflux system protein